MWKCLPDKTMEALSGMLLYLWTTDLYCFYLSLGIGLKDSQCHSLGVLFGSICLSVFLSFYACVHFVAVCKSYVFNPVFICVCVWGDFNTSPSLIPRYGIFERCRELVEAGFDVRQPDKENVTLLHWAAINNRIDLVKWVQACFV